MIQRAKSRVKTPAPRKRRTVEELVKDAGPIATFVRQRRKNLGLTQAELAERVGVGLNFLRQLELGKRTVRVDKVNQVLLFFGAELRATSIKGER